MPFGAEFRCEHCGVICVLILDRALVPLSTLQKQGEKVCTTCGRVAPRDARFCQLGHPLIRKCVNQKCFKEFAVDHQRCDYCGWLQHVKPGTTAAATLEVERAISGLSDPDDRVVWAALTTIGEGGASAKSVAGTAIPAILAFIESRPAHKGTLYWEGCSVDTVATLESTAWKTLAGLGPAPSSQAVPALRQRIEESGVDVATKIFLIRCLMHISPNDALPYCTQMLEENPENEYAVYMAFLAGQAAIPVLERFSGFFRNNGAREALKALRGGHEWPPSVWPRGPWPPQRSDY